MTSPSAPAARPGPARAAITPFPRAGRRVEHAYRELAIAETGDAEQRRALGDLRLLPRPWDPATCVDRQLRAELWQWLEQVASWFNHEYVWDPGTAIPACWPQHPHLVHELAVLADLRRRAGLAFTADGLEEWHRYAVPAFTDRLRTRMQALCTDRGHEPWPAAGRYARHTGDSASQERTTVFAADVRALQAPPAPADPAPTNRPGPPPGPAPAASNEAAPARPRLLLVDGRRVDEQTGEILD